MSTMGFPLRTYIADTCKKCGGYLTETAYGTGIWDFSIKRDPHECRETDRRD